jgi:superfamily II DNA/RNA helicase
VRAAALHGGKSQPQRTRTLAQFKTGHVTVLVATNVAARGIHIDNLDLVVNVDPPTDPKDYLHRGGRTARAGETGSVVTLTTPDQHRAVTRLMATAGIVPQTTRVRPGDAALHRITGAQEAPGFPVTLTAAPVADRPARGSARRGRRSRSSQTAGRSARRASADSAA